MKTVAVRLDGFLVENPAALPNVDPVPAPVELIRVLSAGGYTKIYMVTFTPISVPTAMIRAWLLRYQIPFSEILRLDLDDDQREEDQILSAAGARSTVLGLYITTIGTEAEYMAERGVPAICFVHGDPVIDYRPQRGLTWSSLGLPQEDAEEVPT